MNRDDIIRLAREAGAIQHVYDTNPPGYGPLMFDCAALERFAALVAAAERERAITIAKDMKEGLQAKFEQTYMEGVIAGAAVEREACAKVCEAWGEWQGNTEIIAKAIRARGQE